MGDNSITVLVVEDEVLVRMDIVQSLEETVSKCWKRRTRMMQLVFSMSIPKFV